MKSYKILFCFASALMGLSSCLSENPYAANDDNNGNMRLSVDVLTPETTTRAASNIDTRTFPVTIYASDGSVVKEYESQSVVPTLIPLEVGKYTVSAHQPGELQQKMDAPYYMGSKDLEILKGITTDVDLICKMANSCITLNYSEEFLATFTSWSVTVNDGNETALSFESEAGIKTQTMYWVFKDNASTLTVNFAGISTEGNKISATNYLTKTQATEKYDDDNAAFSGGDALTLNFTPVESTEGDLESINITANVVFTETNEEISVDVWDKLEDIVIPGGGDNPGGGGDNPGGGGDGPDSHDSPITLDLPQPISYPIFGGDGVDKKLGDTYIAAEDGIKSIVVSIESTSDDMISSLADLKEQYGVDFISGAEIVENQNVVQLFQDLDQPLTVPSEGDKEYTFPIGNFFGLLQVLAGNHTFHLTVTDVNGLEKIGDVVISITY